MQRFPKRLSSLGEWDVRLQAARTVAQIPGIVFRQLAVFELILPDLRCQFDTSDRNLCHVEVLGAKH